MNDGQDLTKERTPDAVALNVRSVSKTFTTRPVLRKIDLTLPRGQAVCLCGINGAGKSTLLRVIAGLLHPDSGSVEIDACSLRDRPDEAKRRLGMVSHASMVYPELTVVENLAFAARLYGVRNRKQRIQELLARVELASFQNDPAGILSRGLLQRLAIARALVHQPAVLLADEPFTGLDAGASEHLIGIFRDFVQGGNTILMTTHDVRVGLRCCDRVTVLDKGVLILDALKGQIDAERFARDYLSYARRAN